MRRALWAWPLVLLGGCFVDEAQVASGPAQSCETYCALAVSYCDNRNLLFADPNTCPGVCAGFDSNGVVGATDGNTLQCRLTYLFAAHRQPFAFCREAAPDSLSCL